MEIQENTQGPTMPMQLGKCGDETIDLFLSGKPVLTKHGASLTINGTLHHPSIRSLVKTNSEAFVGVFILGLLKEFLVFVPNSLTPPEVGLYADKIMSHCPTWNTSDLVLCLKNGMDGKYGETKYHWKWTVFVEWAKKYDQEKDDFFFKRHVEKVNNAKMDNADIVKLLPKELIDQFAKEKFVDQEKRKLLDIKIPKDIVDKGLQAVDEYIEQIRNSKKIKHENKIGYVGKNDYHRRTDKHRRPIRHA